MQKQIKDTLAKLGETQSTMVFFTMRNSSCGCRLSPSRNNRNTMPKLAISRTNAASLTSPAPHGPSAAPSRAPTGTGSWPSFPAPT